MRPKTANYTYNNRQVRVVLCGAKYRFVAADVRQVLCGSRPLPENVMKSLTGDDLVKVKRGKHHLPCLFLHPKDRHYNLLSYQAVERLCHAIESEASLDFSAWAHTVAHPNFWREFADDEVRLDDALPSDHCISDWASVATVGDVTMGAENNRVTITLDVHGLKAGEKLAFSVIRGDQGWPVYGR